MLSHTALKRLEQLPKLSVAGKQVNGLFNLMKCNSLWESAYERIARNQGSLTPGVDGKTFDGFSPERLHALTARVFSGTYAPLPVRRVYIPKANGKLRPLGIPTVDDRLVQEVVRDILERIYEPVFSEHSHGFRPERSCHTALHAVHGVWTGVKWFVEIDVVGFFDNIDHETLLKLLAKRIDDSKFIGLIRSMLKAGYLEDWRVHKTYSGTPQGGIVSPLLANVYLHELDEFMDVYRRRFDQGKVRAVRAEYSRLNMNAQHRWKKVHRLRSEGKADDPAVDRALREIAVLNERRAAMPVTEPFDPNFRRLRYVRYADDFLIGVIGSKNDAHEIMANVRTFLADRLNLEASEEKSKIAKASDGVRFLGYDVRTFNQRRTHRVRRNGRTFKPRISADLVQLSLPWDKVAQFCAAKGYGDWSSLKSCHRSYLLHCSDVEIAMAYNAEIRGFANYYALAWDVKKKLNKLHHVWISSFGRTLAGKHQCRPQQVFDRMRCKQDYQISYEIDGKAKTVKLWTLRELMNKPARYGAIDTAPNMAVWNVNRNEFVERLNANQCEHCGASDTACEVHHVRKMADMKAAPFGRLMISARTRKRIVLCKTCHVDLHAGRLQDRRHATA